MIQEKFIAIISEVCFYDESEMNLNLSIQDDLAISSVMMVELIAELEGQLKINLEQKIDAIIECVTVGDFLLVVEKTYQEQNGLC